MRLPVGSRMAILNGPEVDAPGLDEGWMIADLVHLLHSILLLSFWRAISTSLAFLCDASRASSSAIRFASNWARSSAIFASMRSLSRRAAFWKARSCSSRRCRSRVRSRSAAMIRSRKGDTRGSSWRSRCSMRVVADVGPDDGILLP